MRYTNDLSDYWNLIIDEEIVGVDFIFSGLFQDLEQCEY